MKNTKIKSPDIHSTAVVHPGAKLGNEVTVGPYSVIGPEVEIGDNTVIMNHVTVEGPTVIGRDNRIFPYASIGLDPQDKKFIPPQDSRLEIGNGNTIREYVTINRGTEEGGAVTRIGNDNWIMAYCHIAHDCQVGDHTIFANGSTLAGHVTIENHVYLGGFTAVHQFCTIGEMTMTGGHTMIAQDVPPYLIAVGNRAKLFGVNKIGLERNGLTAGEIRDLQAAFKMFHREKGDAQATLSTIEQKFPNSPHARKFVAFIRSSARGVIR